MSISFVCLFVCLFFLLFWCGRWIRFLDTREAAFVNAIVAAGVTYAVTQGCSSGLLLQCTCDKTIKGPLSVVACFSYRIVGSQAHTHTHTHTHTPDDRKSKKKEKEKKETCLRVFFCNNCFPMDFRARFTNDGVSRMSIEFRRPEGVHGLMSSHSPSERPFSHAFRSSSFVLVSFGLDFRL